MRDSHYFIPTPTADQIEQRWQQSLAQFELWTQIWAENPDIAKRSGARVEELMMPIDAVRQRYAKSWSV